MKWLADYYSYRSKLWHTDNNADKKKSQKYCSEFVAMLLQRMKIMAPGKAPWLYTPGELINRQFDLHYAHKFSYARGRLVRTA